MNAYEANEQKARNQRAIGYSLLWIFLGVAIFYISVKTGQHYPLDVETAVLLALIGLVKLGYELKRIKNSRVSSL